MVKVKLFEKSSVQGLEEEINIWLSEHKDIAVLQSNLVTGKSHSFYVLYSSPEARTEELKELAADASPGESVPSTEINPEILKPGSIYNQ